MVLKKDLDVSLIGVFIKPCITPQDQELKAVGDNLGKLSALRILFPCASPKL